MKDIAGDSTSSKSNKIKTVLLVDDEKPILDLGKEILNHYGFETITAEDGEKAIEIFTGEKTEISLVIMDLNMPGMNGYQCFEKLLEIEPETKIILVSGYCSTGEVQDLLEKGASGFLAKPFRFEELIEKLEEVLMEI